MVVTAAAKARAKTSTHSSDGSIDATLISPDEYASRCRQHRWLELLTLWLPPCCVVLRRLPPPVHVLDPGLLKAVGRTAILPTPLLQPY